MPYVLLPKARRLALAACAAASSMAIAATAHATVIQPDNYFGGLNNHDHLDVINGDTRFDISSASIQRIGTGGGTLEVVINTNYAGMPGTPAAIGTGYGALFLTPGAHAWHPTGVAPYPTDVFTPGEWAYAFTIPGIPTASTGSGGLYLTSGGTIVMSNIHGNPVSAPTPGNPGFYFRQGGELVLGPFQGKPACVRIPLGKGVCGAAAARAATILVPDVREFPGHIACDPVSCSELVVPLIEAGAVSGVLDLDSPLPARFDEVDQAGCERLVALFVEHHHRYPR